MYQKLPHLNLPLVDGPRLSNMFGLAYIGARLNLGNIYYHQTVSRRHSNLVLTFSYLKDLENMDTFNISGVYGEK